MIVIRYFQPSISNDYIFEKNQLKSRVPYKTTPAKTWENQTQKFPPPRQQVRLFVLPSQPPARRLSPQKKKQHARVSITHLLASNQKASPRGTTRLPAREPDIKEGGSSLFLPSPSQRLFIQTLTFTTSLRAFPHDDQKKTRPELC